jgi:hypothetical protein
MSNEENKKVQPTAESSSADKPKEPGKLPGHADDTKLPEVDKVPAVKRPGDDAGQPHSEADTKQQPESVSENSPSATGEETDGDRFDFGGLPNRNLKKNLGCG